MSFTPILPLSGYTGWTFLQRTLDSQKAVFAKGAEVQRDADYFRENIGKIDSAEALVSDYRLLKVALGAFGLGDDINNRYFIQRILSDGTTSSEALSAKLADKTYARLSAAFGFGEEGTPLNQNEGFADMILTAYQDRQFEIAIGDRDEAMRLALNAKRELSDLASRSEASSDDTLWYSVMGSTPLRKVFETALGLPTGFGKLDLDQQLSTLRSKTEALLGSSDIAQFSDPDRIEGLVRRYLLRAEAASGTINPMTPGAGALLLLQAAGMGAETGTEGGASNILSLLG